MALGDGIRRNIADVEPTERALLRDALIELNQRHFPGTRTDSPAGGVTWWFTVEHRARDLKTAIDRRVLGAFRPRVHP